MSDLYVYLICSRNKDNKDIPNFKERAKTILEYKENEDKVIKEFHRFAADGVPGEQTRLYRSVNSRNEEKIREELIIRLLTMKQKLPGSQKKRKLPLIKLLIVYFELNWQAYAATIGASQPSVFNFFRYAFILRSLLN